jgi:pre-rRNA-processing protein TSR1
MTSNLPFRFQAGSTPLPAAHHHRSTTKVSNRPFKSRHATKGALKEKAKGRIESSITAGERKTPQQQVTSNLKAARKNQAKQKRLQQQASRAKAVSIFSGRNGAARLVAVVPLGATVDVDKAVQELAKPSSEGQESSFSSVGKVVNCHMARFKQSVTFLKCSGDIMNTLETARMADYVMFVLDAVEMPDEEVETMLRAVESQGISTALACVQVCHPAKLKYR